MPEPGYLWSLLGMQPPAWVQGLNPKLMTPAVPQSTAQPTVQPPNPTLQLPDVSIPRPTIASPVQQAPISIQTPPMQPLPTPPTQPPPPAPSARSMPDFSGGQVSLPNFGLSNAGTPDYSRARSALEAGRPTPPDLGQESSSSTAAILGGLARGAGSVSATEPGSFAKALAAMGAGGSEARSKAIEGGLNRQQEFERERTRFQEATAGQERSEADSAQRAREFNIQQQTAQEEARQRAREFNAGEAVKAEIERQKVRDANAAVADQHALLSWKTGFENDNRLYEHALQEHNLEAPQVEKLPNGFAIRNPMTGQLDFYDTRTVLEKSEKSWELMKGLAPGDPMADVRVMEIIKNERNLPPPVKIATLKEWMLRSSAATGQIQSIFGNQWSDIYKKVSEQLQKDKNFDILKTTHPTDFMKEVTKQSVSQLMTQLLQSDDNRWVAGMAAAGNPIAKAMLSGEY